MNSNLKHLRDKLQSLHLSTEQHKEVLGMIEEACEIGIQVGYVKGYVEGEIEAYNSL